MTLVTIGAISDLADQAYSGFSYPSLRTLQRLIGNGTAAGNVAIQEGSKPYRQATISVLAESTADFETVRGYYENGSQVDFVDRTGYSRTVLLEALTPAAHPGEDAWDVTLTLLELTDPVAPGS